uniref:Uncharacterized protein n=1 Tax=Kalanchoe fedtschenkoi TaxID=63787 RepID=A0A7N0ZWR6_KALFE
MAINTTTTAAIARALGFLAGRFPIAHSDAEITDWEFVDTSDLSYDDLVYILSDEDESGKSSALLLSMSAAEDRAAEDGEEFHAGVSGLAVVAVRAYGGSPVADHEGGMSEEVVEGVFEDPESEEDDDQDDLDDELVPWSVGDRFGRQRMRKLGGRAYAKMNKTKKFPYTLNRPGCVRGKHGLGRKG